MPDLVPGLVLGQFAGIDMPNFLDALLRVIFIVALMTINAFALIYLERKILARLQARVGPTRTGADRHAAVDRRRAEAGDEGRCAAGDGRPLGVRACALHRVCAGLPDFRADALHGDLVHPRPRSGAAVCVRRARAEHCGRGDGGLGVGQQVRAAGRRPRCRAGDLLRDPDAADRGQRGDGGCGAVGGRRRPGVGGEHQHNRGQPDDDALHPAAAVGLRDLPDRGAGGAAPPAVRHRRSRNPRWSAVTSWNTPACAGECSSWPNTRRCS